MLESELSSKHYGDILFAQNKKHFLMLRVDTLNAYTTYCNQYSATAYPQTYPTIKQHIHMTNK